MVLAAKMVPNHDDGVLGLAEVVTLLVQDFIGSGLKNQGAVLLPSFCRPTA